ncbi:MAG TPA: YSC84-related protein [Candidatus Acidoferrales bacterium]|nr:YSC84-related protein [Candidatus Acidoferrales bacterium]
MRNVNRVLAIVALALSLTSAAEPAFGASAKKINQEAHTALQHLYAKSDAARLLSKEAKGILVFPGIYKAGFIIGGAGGDGVLTKDGHPVAYYRSVAASYGLQAGVQKFGYALFFMKDEALGYLDKSEGWELGVGPSIVVVDAGVGKSLTTTTGRSDVYAFIFSQKGLMAGIGIQGSKITKITPDE